MFEMYKKAVASFWTTDEVDLSQDMRDWERLTGGCPADLTRARWKPVQAVIRIM